MYAHRGWVDKGQDLAYLRPLTPLFMQSLQYENMHDAVMELFTDILLHFPAFLMKENMHTLSLYLTTGQARHMIDRMKAGDLDEDTSTHARLLLAFAEA